MNMAPVSRRHLLQIAGISTATLLTGAYLPSFAIEGGAQTNPGQKAKIMFGMCGRMKDARMLKDAGCEYIEEAVGGLLMPDKPDEEFAKRLPEISAALIPVKNCNSFLPGSLKSVGPNHKLEDVLAYANIAFRRARMCGVEIITYGSGGSRAIPKDFSKEDAQKQFVEVLKGMGPLAAAQGIKVSIEPLRAQECNFLNNIREVAEMIRAANHPHIGITADLYHMVLGGDEPQHLDDNVDILHHFHIAEVKNRALPGVAGDDFRGWFKVLAKHGWNGRISIEGGGKKDEESLTKSYAYLRAQAAEAGI